jgi:transcriptional regulator with XRE-family HTH domain
MKAQSEGAELGAKVSARIREFRTARGISEEALAEAAKLSASEMRLLNEGSEEINTNMVNRIANALGVHSAVLYMFPDEHPLASLLEKFRDLPKDEFKKLAAEIIAKGFHHSKGSA